jgi:ADP-heptose:LPS heptosyltransferase
MSLMQFRVLVDIPQLALFSLQRGSQAAQLLTPPPGMRITNLEDNKNDITDTAAIIMNLDLVLSVDTMIAHLAGALAKPVWTLIPFSWEWRYLTDRHDTPWYPTMRLFRQPRPKDWEPPLEEVRKALSETLRERRGTARSTGEGTAL